MPPRTKEYPKYLQPFVAHGLDPSSVTEDEAQGSCVFCGKAKFFVGLTDGNDAKHFKGGWKCQSCAREGNLYDFIQAVWSECYVATSREAYLSLGTDRGLSPDSLRLYGLCRSFTGDWVAPGYGVKGTIVNLYRWRHTGKKRTMIPTPGGDLHHGYFRPVTVPANHDATEIAEGVWSACARYDSLNHTNPDSCARTLIVGTPGCENWSEGWGNVAEGRPTAILFDNDHPKVNAKTGATRLSAWSGTKRTAELLLGYSPPPSEVHCLRWGPEGFDATLPDGYDLRDVSCEHNGTAVSFVDSRVVPVPTEWVPPPRTGKPSAPSNNVSLTPLPCSSWSELCDAWRGAIHYTDEFEQGLVFALSVAAAVTWGDNRLWGRMIGVPSTGKSMICKGLSTDEDDVVTESTVTSFYSGMDKNDGVDHSFVNKLWDKLWVNNDADTMRTNPNREELFAQMRDFFGGSGSKAFGNGVGSRKYDGLRFGVLFAGTPEIYQIDGADLGARFLDFFFVKPCPEVEEMIVLSALDRQLSGNSDQHGMSPELKRATCMTGGYLKHVREQIRRSPPRVILSMEEKRYLYRLGKYVGKLRSRPPTKQTEEMDRSEIPTRVTTQLGSLVAMSMVVRGVTEPDNYSFELTRRVGIDTGRGRTEGIVRAVSEAGEQGLDFRGITGCTRKAAHKEAELVDYLCEIRVLDRRVWGVAGYNQETRYVIHPEFEDVYRSVHPQGQVT